MRHAKPYRKLSRQRSHYRALMRNLALALFENERIHTTVIKAKESRRFIDKIITLGKKGTLAARRQAMALMGNKIIHVGGKKVDIIGKKVFGDFATRFKDRNGGYTRILKIGNRPGDAAPVCIFELIGADIKTKVKKVDDSKAAAPKAESKPKKAKKKAEAKAA